MNSVIYGSNRGILIIATMQLIPIPISKSKRLVDSESTIGLVALNKSKDTLKLRNSDVIGLEQ